MDDDDDNDDNDDDDEDDNESHFLTVDELRHHFNERMQRRIIRAGFNDRMNALPKSQQNEVGGRINEAFEGILKNMMAEVNGLGEGGLEVTVEASRRFADQVQRTIKSVFSNDPDYKRLQEIERRRRAILKRKDASFFRTLLFWDGTVLHAVIRESMLYINPTS